MNVTEDRRKKILIFSIAYVPFVGGAELAVKEITSRISDIQFDMITLQFDKNLVKVEQIGNINVYRIRSSKLFFPFAAFSKALVLYKENKYRLIWAVMANRAGLAALFFKIFHPKVKFLLTLQEGDAPDYPKKQMGLFWFVLKPLFKAIFTKADYIQTISNYLAVWARNMGYKGRLEIVPNGVDLQKFKIQNSKFKINELKQELGIKDNDKILITTSRLVEKNAIGDIIEALKYLPENIKFLILGEGPLKENLKSKIKNLKLENRVLLMGHIEPHKVPNYLAISDIFVRPSLSEGLGSSFLEAMAAGVPVIATRVGGIPDFLKNGETGLFCEVRNPQSIAEKVMGYLNNPSRTNKIVENAQKLIRENYDWDLIAQKMGAIFNKLCAY